MKRVHRFIALFKRKNVTMADAGQIALVDGAAYLVTSRGLHRLPIYPTIKKLD